MRLARLAAPATLTLALLVAPLAAEGQAAKVPQVGLLWFGSRLSERSSAEAFTTGLRELGYVEGQTVVLQSRFAEGSPERLATAAAELVGLGVDVLVTYGDVGVRAAKHATSTLPIVVALTGDLVDAGHAASLARPGGNVTGLVDTSPELSAKRVELLQAAVPAISRLAVVWNPSNRVKVLDFQMTQVAARTLGVPLQSIEVRHMDDIGPAVADRGAGTNRRAPSTLGCPHERAPRRHCRARQQAPASEHVLQSGVGGGRRPDGLWTQLAPHVPTGSDLRGQNPKGREARRATQSSSPRSSSSSSTSRPRRRSASRSRRRCSRGRMR